MTEDRPRADELLPVLVERPGKLIVSARQAAGLEWRCPPHRHLLAAAIQTVCGPWLYWHGDPRDGWRCDWQTDLDSPTVNAWCNCPNAWTVDTAEPGKPPTLQ
jgi:hypothetical protein